ncbi:hypothetical protein Hanom_Chr13g01191511 [Helianthus anomalus]
MRLVHGNKETLRRLLDELGEPERMKHLRSFYEEKSTAHIGDKEFSKLMLLDSCFILMLFAGNFEDFPELNRNQFVAVAQDLMLLENQIPFEVLTEVMKLTEVNCLKDIEEFINVVSFVRPMRRKRTWLQKLKVIRSLLPIRNDTSSNEGGHEDDEEPSHFLALVRAKLTKIDKTSKPTIKSFKYEGWNFRNASELVNAGISFEALKETTSLTRIEFDKGWWEFSGNVKLPPITLYDNTKQMLLNMIAYETYCCPVHDAWVTTYVWLLDCLIDDVKDVKVLRKAWVIDNNLSSDKEVATLFNEIAIDIVLNNLAYNEAMNKIQRHYASLSNTLLSQLKNEYFKSPWAMFALLGALIALFLTGVQTYYTVWSPKSKCDDLCQFLKINHHL